MSHLGRGILVCLALGVHPALALRVSAATDTPWDSLTHFRAAIESAGPLSANYLQTFTPAGFDSSEREEGTLAVDLPDCLRWDYAEPFPKSFLLCGDKVHYWNPGESHGEIYTIDDRDTPGLDFFLLSPATLRERYRATSVPHPEGRVAIRLIPLEPSQDLVEARVELDPEATRLLTLVYFDAEGSETRFEIGDYRAGVEPNRFRPPPDIEWEEP